MDIERLDYKKGADACLQNNARLPLRNASPILEMTPLLEVRGPKVSQTALAASNSRRTS